MLQRSSVLDALPPHVAQTMRDGLPVTVAGTFVGSTSSAAHSTAGETPDRGKPAIRRWVALLDRAEQLMDAPDPRDPNPQRTASKAFDSLILYEHQLTPVARLQAREFVWHRDHPGQQLPTTPLHRPDERPPEPLCLCTLCREQWRDCRCRTCQLTRRQLRARACVTQHTQHTQQQPKAAAPAQS